MAQKQHVIAFPFPLGGMDRHWAEEAQPPFSSPDLLNVRGYETLEGRARGGQRPGLGKCFPIIDHSCFDLTTSSTAMLSSTSSTESPPTTTSSTVAPCDRDFSDGFDSQEDPLAGNWTQDYRNGKLNWIADGDEGVFEPPEQTTAETACIYDTEMCTVDHQAAVVVTQVPEPPSSCLAQVGTCVRVNSAASIDNCYEGHWQGELATQEIRLSKIVAGVWTSLGSDTYTGPPTNIVTKANGTTIRLDVDAKNVEVVDSSVTTGKYVAFRGEIKYTEEGDRIKITSFTAVDI